MRQTRPSSSSAGGALHHQAVDTSPGAAESQLWRQTLDALDRGLPKTQDSQAHLRLQALFEEGLMETVGKGVREKVARQLLAEEEGLDREIACVPFLPPPSPLLRQSRSLMRRLFSILFPTRLNQSLRCRARVAFDPPRPPSSHFAAGHALCLDARLDDGHRGEPSPAQARPSAQECRRFALVVHLANERPPSGPSSSGGSSSSSAGGGRRGTRRRRRRARV